METMLGTECTISNVIKNCNTAVNNVRVKFNYTFKFFWRLFQRDFDLLRGCSLCIFVSSVQILLFTKMSLLNVIISVQ